jgi:hypothetical protein
MRLPLKLTVVAKPIIPIADIVPICANNTISINAGAPTDSFCGQQGDNSFNHYSKLVNTL